MLTGVEVLLISLCLRLCHSSDTNGGALDLIMCKAMIE